MAESANEFELTAEQLQQHPGIALLLILFAAFMFSLFAASVFTWVAMLVRLRRGENVLPVQDWTPRVWGLLDLIMLAALVIVGQTIALKLWAMVGQVDLAQMRTESDFPLSAMASVSASYLIVMFVMTAWFLFRYRSSLTHLGLAGGHWFSNVRLGLAAAVVVLPVVYALMALVSLGQEYDHPLLERMGEEASLSAFLFAFFAAVIVAPLTEEFLFRVVLQGWLQSLPWSTRHLQWFTGASQAQRQLDHSLDAQIGPLNAGANSLPDSLTNSLTNSLSSSVPGSMESANPYRVSNAFDQTDSQVEAFGPPGSFGIRPPLWPVLVSGTLFGMAHWGYGLSFIPLILLGIVLGLLYRATHSIWPGLVVHFILNFIAILGLGISMLIQAFIQ